MNALHYVTMYHTRIHTYTKSIYTAPKKAEKSLNDDMHFMLFFPCRVQQRKFNRVISRVTAA